MKMWLALVCVALMTACVIQRPGTESSWIARGPFKDFYDSVFVLTDGGTVAPREMDMRRLAVALRDYNVIFYGEIHGHPGVHLSEMKLLRALDELDPHWVLSMEQFERDVQGTLDDYIAGRIGETTLINAGRAWNNYAASYRPLLEFAKEQRLPVVAAEAPGWAISCIGQSGTGILQQFSPVERSWVAAEIHAGPGAYRDQYMQFLGASAIHGVADTGPAAAQRAQRDAQNSFAAQAARDDTMAESIEKALQQHPGYRVLHLTGSFHSANFLGSVERLRMRLPNLKIAVINPIEVKSPDSPAAAPGDLQSGTALQLVYPSPAEFVEGEDMSTWLARMHDKHTSGSCKYTLPTTVG